MPKDMSQTEISDHVFLPGGCNRTQNLRFGPYTIGEYFMKSWNRFLDDYFVPWARSLNDLNRLHYILNSLHPSIIFTIEYSQKELPFLDVLVKKTETSIDTDIHFKPTDSQQYLIFDSCQPKHIKLSIP